MSAGRSWGADTVALGERDGSDEPTAARPRSTTRGAHLRRNARALVAVALVLAPAILLIADSNVGDSRKEAAPIREVADPHAPHRRAPDSGRKPTRMKRAGRLLEREREPRARASTPESPPPAPAPPAAEAEPAPPAETAPKPTAPAAEFGL